MSSVSATAETAKKPMNYILKMAIPFAIYILFKFFLKAPAPMTQEGLEIVGIFLMALYFWIFVGTGWTSLLTICLVGVSGVVSATATISGSIGDWMFSFLFGCMLVNYTMSEVGLSRRIAVWFITRKFVKGRPWVIVSMFLMALFILGLGMTSSATCVMFCALATEILGSTGYKDSDRFSQMLFCAIAWLAIAGNGMTAIGHGNFITGIGWVMETFGVEITIFQSAAICATIGLIWLISLICIMKFVYKMDAGKLVDLDIDALKATVPPMSRKEKIVGVLFAVVIFMWIADDLLGILGILPGLAAFCKSLGSALPILLCVCALCIIRVEGKPIMEFNRAVKNIAWQSCMMIACVRFLGNVFSMEDLGIIAWINSILEPLTSAMPGYLFVVVCIAIPTIMTNLMSNSIAMLFFKIAGPISLVVAGVNGPALGVIIICTSMFAFWTPGCTTTTSFVVGSGQVNGSFMVKHGWLPMLANLVIQIAIGYTLACAILG